MRFLLVACAFALAACGSATPAKAPPAQEDLAELTQRVMSDTKYWEERGIHISSAGPDAERGVVVVRVPDPAEADELPAHYGGLVVVEEGGPLVPAT